MAVTLINSFVVPADQADAFLESWSKTAEAVQAAPGFISATLHRALHDDAKFAFVNVAQWESEDLYHAAFTNSPIPPGGIRPEAYPALYQVAARFDRSPHTPENRPMPDASTETQVIGTINEMNAALVSADVAVLERVFADSYVFTTPIGTTLDKRHRIESVRSGQRKISSLTFPELKVQVYGDAAVATSRYIEVVEPQHTPQEGRITNVFVRLDGRWQMVAGQSYSAAVTQSDRAK